MAKTAKKPVQRKLDARPDTMDFRDVMYVPTLIEVPTHIPVEDFLRFKVPVLDQGTEGACTGFGVATVANYLLLRRRVVPDKVPVSPRMLYELAKRYDEWPGEAYAGSSARGAMKGWHKHGVCSESDWSYHPSGNDPAGLTDARTSSALHRPLGAYFRVNHRDLVAMHSAIAEVGVLYATAAVHRGWDAVGSDGHILQSDQITGGHAFAIIAYDQEGFWLQNSWGRQWGRSGLARISYDDWLRNGTDIWVARLGAPVTMRRVASTAAAHASTAGQSAAYSYADLRPHIISIGNNGKLKPGGNYGTSPEEVAQIFESDIPRVIKDWPQKRLVLYTHGGLVSEAAAVQRVADYRPALLESGVYPLAFIWRSDYWTTITNILQDAIRRRRPEGVLDAAKDFMLNRLDDALEPLARALTGKAAWDEMKENALAASAAGGGARLVLEHVAKLRKRFPDLEMHVVGHSAGAIFHAPLLQLLTAKGKIAAGPMKGASGYGLPVASCTLWAPACTIELFKEAYLPAIQNGLINRFALFALKDQTEQDDHCARIYNKSLLYLVSHAFESPPRIPLFRDGVPILGMQRFIEADQVVMSLFKTGKADLVIAPNNEPLSSIEASGARHHGDFDDDKATVHATFARILKPKAVTGKRAAAPARLRALDFSASQSSLRERRIGIDVRTQREQV